MIISHMREVLGSETILLTVISLRTEFYKTYSLEPCLYFVCNITFCVLCSGKIYVNLFR